MAIACPVDLDTLQLRAEIESIYRRVATEPSGDFHFHRGPTYAAEMLGYDAVALARLPAETTASFAGLGDPSDRDRRLHDTTGLSHDWGATTPLRPVA